MEIICRPITESEFEQAMAIRIRVFVEEQHVPIQEERDHLDATAQHFGAFVYGQMVGTGRIVSLDKQAKLGRIAVLPEYRGRHIGFKLVEHMVQWARNKGFREAVLGAQVQAIGFYERLGFKAEGDVFDDAGIPHRTMRLALAERDEKRWF